MAGMLGDRVWDRYRLPNQEIYLEQKLGYAFYGMPGSVDTEHQYNTEQKAVLSKLKETCIKLITPTEGRATSICLSFIFISAYKNDSHYQDFPLIRIMKPSQRQECTAESWFIDIARRVYENWKDFKSTNIFNGWYLALPKNGKYPFIESLSNDLLTTEDADLQVDWIEWHERSMRKDTPIETQCKMKVFW